MSGDRSRRVTVSLTVAQVDALLFAAAERDTTLEDMAGEEAPYGPKAVAERGALRRARTVLQDAIDPPTARPTRTEETTT